MRMPIANISLRRRIRYRIGKIHLRFLKIELCILSRLGAFLHKLTHLEGEKHVVKKTAKE